MSHHATATAVAPSPALTKRVAAYQKPSRGRAIWQLVNTLGPYVLTWVAAWYAFQISPWLTILPIILLAFLTIRTFILFHDCGHMSFFPSRRANNIWGIILGILTFTPYNYWHAGHARHHATSANLDKRGFGDVWMLTVREYYDASPKEQRKYRMYRNPFMMFLLGPLLIILVNNRTVTRNASAKEKRNILITNIGIVVVGVTLSLLIGWQEYLLIQFGSLYLGLVMGVWLFYVQHQFEDVYWTRQENWDFVRAALEGGSFYDLPPVFRWFTGSIGYHHVHHLNSRIPNYHLAACHEAIPELQDCPRINFFTSLKALNYRLLDEDTGRMVNYREARELMASRA